MGSMGRLDHFLRNRRGSARGDDVATEDKGLSAFQPTWAWKSFRSEIAALDRGLDGSLVDLPRLARAIPLDVWGDILLDPARHLPVSGAALPVMPTPEIQINWTGSHGGTLLRQSVAFIRSLVAAAGDDLYRGPVLDYGVGWGRLSRLLLKYVAVEQILGVDAKQYSLDHARSCGIPHPLRLVSDRLAPTDLEPDHYSFVYAFSVFTHFAPAAFEHNLRALSVALRPGGRLVVTTRPAEWWAMPGYAYADPAKIDRTFSDGIVHIDADTPQVDDWGDTAVSNTWMAGLLTACGLVDVGVDWNHEDPYQLVWSAKKAG
jgi:SAM-dependent methyltransferase